MKDVIMLMVYLQKYICSNKTKNINVKVFNKITSVNGTELLVINIFHAIANGNIIERNVI